MGMIHQQSFFPGNLLEFDWLTGWLYNNNPICALLRLQVVESAEEPNAQYLQIAETEDVQGTEAAVSVLQNLRFNTHNGLYQDFEM